MNVFKQENGIVLFARRCLVVSLGAMGFSFLISLKREHKRRPRNGFQGLSNPEEKHSTMSLSTLMTFRLTFQSIFFPAKCKEVSVSVF